MLSRQHRFHGYTSLSPVYRHGSTARNPHMLLRFLRNPKRTDYRLAVIVSRKVHKSAVKRNRVRRRLYEIVRTGRPISVPYDIVLTIFSEQIIDMEPKELTRLVTGLLGKAGIYATNPRPMSTPHAIVKAREDGQ